MILTFRAVELGLDLGHVAELGRADRREVLRVREQHGPRVADPVVEADRGPPWSRPRSRGPCRNRQRHRLGSLLQRSSSVQACLGDLAHRRATNCHARAHAGHEASNERRHPRRPEVRSIVALQASHRAAAAWAAAAQTIAPAFVEATSFRPAILAASARACWTPSFGNDVRHAGGRAGLLARRRAARRSRRSETPSATSRSTCELAGPAQPRGRCLGAATPPRRSLAPRSSASIRRRLIHSVRRSGARSPDPRVPGKTTPSSPTSAVGRGTKPSGTTLGAVGREAGRPRRSSRRRRGRSSM